jgi:hypothetical protein
MDYVEYQIAWTVFFSNNYPTSPPPTAKNPSQKLFMGQNIAGGLTFANFLAASRPFKLCKNSKMNFWSFLEHKKDSSRSSKRSNAIR